MDLGNKISIQTKKLSSGNHQVKFFVADENQPQYGYLLVSEPKPVGDIIDEIKMRMERKRNASRNIDPFFPLEPQAEDRNFYLFSA